MTSRANCAGHLDVLLAAFLISNLVGCGIVPVPTPTPAATPTPMPVTVRQLIDGSATYAGHRVSMTGTVSLECAEGCWFFLDDGTGKIYIDLATAGLHIPQKVGSRVTLRGDIVGFDGNLHIAAEQVDFPE